MLLTSLSEEISDDTLTFLELHTVGDFAVVSCAAVLSFAEAVRLQNGEIGDADRLALGVTLFLARPSCFYDVQRWSFLLELQSVPTI